MCGHAVDAITVTLLTSHIINYFLFHVTYNKIYREKSVPMTALWCPALIHYIIMDNFIMPETHQPNIVIILIIYFYLLKDLVEL